MAAVSTRPSCGSRSTPPKATLSAWRNDAVSETCAQGLSISGGEGKHRRPRLSIPTAQESLDSKIGIVTWFTASPGSSGTRRFRVAPSAARRSEEHTSELQSPYDLVCRLLLEKKKKQNRQHSHK